MTPTRDATSSPASYDGMTGQFIDGRDRAGRAGRSRADLNPFTGEKIAEISLASAADLDDAYAAAARAQPDWAAASPADRAAVLLAAVRIIEARREEVVGWLIRESGSTRTKAQAEWGAVRAGLLEAATFPARVQGRLLPVDIPGKESRVHRRPLGVVGIISPWNWPLHLSNRSIAPALALGNAVVVKPAEDTPITGGLLLARIYAEAGLPPGLLNVVNGEVADIGDAFVLHPLPRFISFTGSTRVGRRIAHLAVTGPQLKRFALELGGNSPLVVLDDADLDQAVRAAVFGRFFHAGQICMSSNRLIVDAAVYDEFVARFVARVRGLKWGDPDRPDTAIGPLINQRQFDAVQARIRQAVATGLPPLLSGPATGLVIPPHVFAGVANDSELAQAEVFGPVAIIIKARDETDALRLANQTEYGLSSAVFTRDESRGVRFALRVEAGMTHVNDSTINDCPNSPFGGEKSSGLGRFNSDWIIAEFTTDHWISVQSSPRPYPF
jgi:aldehyde dehydrogenase (NAD+)